MRFKGIDQDLWFTFVQLKGSSSNGGVELLTEEIFFVEIPGRVGIKKNSKTMVMKGNRLVPISSQSYRAWENKAIFPVLEARSRYQISKPVDIPLRARFEFHFINRQSLPDTSNCIEGPQDLLERAKVYLNDRQIEHIEATRKISGEEKALIWLYKVEG